MLHWYVLYVVHVACTKCILDCITYCIDVCVLCHGGEGNLVTFYHMYNISVYLGGQRWGRQNLN